MPVPILKIKSRAASKHMIPAITVIHRNGSCFLNTNPSSMKCKPGSKVEGFGGFMAGAVIINVENPDNGNDNSATKFGWGFRLGANIWASEKVAIKLQGQLMSAVQSAGGGLYFGTGGAGAGVSTYSSMYQFGLGGGLVISLGGAKAK